MKILVADDDFAARQVLQDALSPLGQCHVAVNGREAVTAFRRALIARHAYDVVLLDITMPEMDGHTALEAIRALESEYGIGGLDGVKVIMTSALSDPKNVIQAFREQCEAYLTKPIDMEKLVAQIQELARPVSTS